MDPSNNTETEDETIALKKKRARRVSFVDNEITSVHIFRRDDEDSETPPNSLPSSAADRKPPENDVLGFFRDLGGDSDEEDLKESSPSRNAGGDDDDYGEAVDVRKPFLRPVGSPSPGSSTACSVASTDDEDDFHGPVSTSFIRPGRLSGSAASDDNNDVTMDSTAFSLHYRSIARSDSGDLKTPTRFGITFEEITPSQTSSPAAPGSSMVLTKSNKQSSQPSVPADAVSGGRDSNDMSIVGENPNKYDYDRLSPSLDAILAEEGKDLYSTIIDSSKQDKLSATKRNKNGYLTARSPEAMCSTEKHDMSVQQLLVCPSKLGDINRCSNSSPVVEVIDDCLSNKGDITVADAFIDQIRTPGFSSKELKEFVKDANGPVQKQLEFPAANSRIPLKLDAGYPLDVSAQHEPGYQHSSEGELKKINLEGRAYVSDTDDHKFDQVYGNSIQGSTPSSPFARKQLSMGSPDSLRHTGIITPPSKQPNFFVHDYVTHGGETLSSIRKSISKLKATQTSPSKSSLKEGIDRLKHRLSNYSPGSTLFIGKDCGNKHNDTLNAPFEEQLFSATLKNNDDQNLINLDVHGTESVRDIAKLSQNEGTVDPAKDEGGFNSISADIFYSGKNPKMVEMVPSSSQMIHLTKVIDFDQADSTVENSKNENAMVRHDKHVFSPVKFYDQKLSPSVKFQSNRYDDLKELKQHNESVNSGLGHSNAFNSPAVAKQSDLSFSGEIERPTSPFEVAVVKQLAQSVSKRKLADSPAKKVLALNTFRKDVIKSPFQELSTLLPSMQEPTSVPLHQDMQNLSPKGNSDEPVDNNCHQALQVSQSPLAKSGIEFSSGKKRKGVEIRDGNNIDKIGRISRSPEAYKIGNSDQQLLLDWSDDIGSQKENTGDQTWKNWADILIKFSEGTKQLLSPSVDKLNMRVIGMLEDILVHLRKVKKCKILCSEIRSQKTTDPLNALRHKRVVEARILLYNIAYAKAKLQLMHMKRERLLGKVQQLSSRLHESQILKLNCISHFSRSRATEGKHQVSCDKVTTMRQELESLKWKAKSLSTYLHTYCKIEGVQSCADTVTLVHDYLRKQMSCKYIFQNLQLWEVDHFEHKQGCYRVLLNYCGYVIQRFIVNAGSPSIIISNQLNDQNIVKTFTDMDGFAAFLFVLNPDSTKKCTGSRFLPQETQITSSLLSNLLDVIEEVQLARVEIKNLVQAKFYSQSDGRLDLLLSFIDFYSGRKLKVTLDMTCLKSGVYPIEILPSQIYDPAIGEQKSLPLSLVAEIRSAAESLRVGYSRITRLCRCISQAVQTCTPSR